MIPGYPLISARQYWADRAMHSFRYKLALLGILFASSVANAQQEPAKNYTVILSDREIAATEQLFDMACKAGGLRSCQPALVVLEKLRTARPVELPHKDAPPPKEGAP